MEELPKERRLRLGAWLGLSSWALCHATRLSQAQRVVSQYIPNLSSSSAGSAQRFSRDLSGSTGIWMCKHMCSTIRQHRRGSTSVFCCTSAAWRTPFLFIHQISTASESSSRKIVGSEQTCLSTFDIFRMQLVGWTTSIGPQTS